MLITIALLPGFIAGLLFHPGEWKNLKPIWLAVSILVSVGITTLLVFAWAFGSLPFDIPVRSWTLLMIFMGMYESAGFLLASFLIPWAPFRTRAKAGLAVISGAIVVGHLTYGGGDRILLPSPSEHADHFARAALFATVAVFAGLIVNQWRRRFGVGAS